MRYCEHCFVPLDYGNQYKLCPKCRRGLEKFKFISSVKKGVKKFNMKTTGDKDVDKKVGLL